VSGQKVEGPSPARVEKTQLTDEPPNHGGHSIQENDRAILAGETQVDLQLNAIGMIGFRNF